MRGWLGRWVYRPLLYSGRSSGRCRLCRAICTQPQVAPRPAAHQKTTFDLHIRHAGLAASKLNPPNQANASSLSSASALYWSQPYPGDEIAMPHEA